MPRPLGRRNPDYEEKKERLINDLTDFVLRCELTRPSFRQLALAGQVAEPTLRHYFGDRETVAAEILRVLGERASPLIEAVGEAGGANAEEAIHTYIQLSIAGVAHGAFARAHAFGLVEGVADERVGRAYLEELLEPSLRALEARLAPFLGPDADPAQRRAAALMMFAPMLLAVIHQQLLGGGESTPIDLNSLFSAIAQLATDAITARG